MPSSCAKRPMSAPGSMSGSARISQGRRSGDAGEARKRLLGQPRGGCAARAGQGSAGNRAAILASFLGWTLDAFDFFLVVFTLTAIAQEFHTSDAAIALSITLTLAFRPVGALLFGLLADRYGRRLPLMIDLVFYSVVEVLSGLAPGYRSFLVLRAL